MSKKLVVVLSMCLMVTFMWGSHQVLADTVIGVNFCSRWPIPHLEGETADGLGNWTDSVEVDETGGENGSNLVLLGSGGEVVCSWSSLNLYHGGSESTSEQQLYRAYLDDGSGGPLITISGLTDWMEAEGCLGYVLRIYQSSDNTNITFSDVYVYEGTGNLQSGGTVLDSVQAANLWGSDGGTRGYVDTVNLAADTITIDTDDRDMGNGIRASVAGVKITGILPGFWESFEDFEGDSGETVNGFAGDDDSGSWTGDSKTVVIVKDGTAFSGTNYLRIMDNDSSQHHVTKTLSSLVHVGPSDTHLTFALRRSLIPGQTAGVSGLTSNFKVTDSDTPGNTGSSVLGYNLFQTAMDGVYDVWFTFEMDINREIDNKIRFENVVVTNTETDQVVYTSGTWYTSGTLSADHDGLSWLRFFSWGSSQAFIDVDAIRLGELEEKTVIASRPYMPYCAFYGATPDHHEMTLAVPNGSDERQLEDHGTIPLWWGYGTQIGWQAGALYWYDKCDASHRIRQADLRYPYDYQVAGPALDEWIGFSYPEVGDWIYDGLADGRDDNPEVFVAIWANGWNDPEMYDMTLDNTVDLLMTEGYTMSPTGGAGGGWTDAIREMEECASRGLERKTVIGLGSITDLPNYGSSTPFWTESQFRYYMEYIKDEYPKCPGVAFFPAVVGDPDDYNAVLDLAGTLAKEYWPDTWLPNGCYAVTPQINPQMRMDVYGSGTSNGTDVRAYNSNYPGDATNQQWRFIEISEGVYRIYPSYSYDVCLDVSGASSSNGAAVQLWTDNNTNAQKWRVVDAENGMQLEPLCSPGNYLTVMGSSTASQFEIWEQQDDRSQVFSITPEICELDPIAPYYQAEDGVMSGGAIYSSGSYGHLDGYVNFPGYSGASVTLSNVDGLEGGNHEIVIRYASAYSAARTIDMTVNGSTTTITLEPTDSWNLWRKKRVVRSLNAGTNNTIIFTTNSSGDPGDIDTVAIETNADI